MAVWSTALSQEAVAHVRRCKKLPPMTPGEQERLVTAFLAVRGFTHCPARYSAPVNQGADPWTDFSGHASSRRSPN